MATDPPDSPDKPGAVPGRSRFRLTPAGLLAGFLLLVVSCCGGSWVYIHEPFTPRYTWEDAGPIQVLANDDELWVFLQVDRWVRIPGKLVSAPNRTTGHFQRVVVLGPEGVRQTVRVVPDDGPRFHPNLGDIFRSDDGFLLFSGPSLGRSAALYRWQADHFEELAASEAQRRIAEVGLEASNNPLKDDLPNAEGWTRLVNVRDPIYDPVEFRWGDVTLVIERHAKMLQHADLQIRCTGSQRGWSASLAQFDATWKPE